MKHHDPHIYGLLAEFDDPDSLIAACNKTRAAKFRRVDAYSPFPVHGLAEALGFRRSRVPLIVLCGGITGALGGFFMQWFANVIHYPINIGGRPYNSWPAWVPITFECTILLAAFGAVFGMLALNGLPMPYHPVFNVKRFENASRDRFFLVIQSRDPKFDTDSVYKFMDTLKPREVVDVPW